MAAQLPRNPVADVLARQAVRCGTSVGANYREALRATSRANFLARIKIVERELDECIYWIKLIEEAGFFPAAKLAELKREADELLAVVASIAKTTRERSPEQKPKAHAANCKL